MAARARAFRRQLSRAEKTGAAVKSAHRVRERGLSECGRVLESSHGDVHDPGQCLHATLRLLRGAEGSADDGGLRRTPAGGGGGSGAGLEVRGGDQRESGRSQGRRRGIVRDDHRGHSRADSRLQGGSAGAGFSGLARGHGHRHERASRCAESQHRNGAQAVPAGAIGRALRAIARHAGVRETNAAVSADQIRC